MAKRFTDTDLFKKRFVRGLQGAYKLLWIYIYHDCNHAGIWEVDFEVASIRIGMKVDEKTAENVFKEKIEILDKGKWFIPSFIEFQYGELNPQNRAHNSVIKILDKYRNKGLTSPLQGCKDKDKDKDKDKKKEKAAIFNNCKEMFLIGYKKLKGKDYRFIGKDAGALAQLIKAIEFTMKSEELEITDKSIQENLRVYLRHASQQKWIKDNYSLTILNSKYNETLAKNGQGNLRETFERMWAEEHKNTPAGN